MKKIVHLTSVHQPFDTRICLRECRSLARQGYEVVLIAPHWQEEIFEGVRNPDAVPGVFEPVHGHDIYLIFQGMIHNTKMALTPVGKQRDVTVVTELYQEDWWLEQLARRNASAIWLRSKYPHK